MLFVDHGPIVYAYSFLVITKRCDRKESRVPWEGGARVNKRGKRNDVGGCLGQGRLRE